jgi:hypothetical protein
MKHLPANSEGALYSCLGWGWGRRRGAVPGDLSLPVNVPRDLPSGKLWLAHMGSLTS